MSNLFTFLTDLAVNPHGQIDFAHNPQATMTAAGLSEAERATVQNGSITQVFTDNWFQPAFFAREPESDPSSDPDSFAFQPALLAREPDTDPSSDPDSFAFQPALIAREPDTDPSSDPE